MDKKALRAEIRERKAAMTPAPNRWPACRALTRQVAPARSHASSRPPVYGYLSYNQEVRTLALLQAALDAGKRVAVPKVLGDTMRFLWISDLSAVAPGYCGIPEPLADGPEADDPHALVLMPGLAFDPSGRRLGYGGGFYDRFLAREPGHPTLALCYDFQLLPHVETAPHDVPVDQVLWAAVPEDCR
ncbi:MAG: 5-formyltetrahydrofolate cyclo-ligase [Oscillospiraceae bacterium]